MMHLQQPIGAKAFILLAILSIAGLSFASAETDAKNIHNAFVQFCTS